MKYLLISLTLILSLNIYAQEDKTVTLVVSGQGATQEEARQKALRGAIEQAFGTFISSKTEILNDNLFKDEIVSVANGNIQKFDIINETLLPNNTYTSTLNATVSISKLTSFCQSKGINAEFKGGLFAMNIAMQELNEKNELKALDDLYKLIISLLTQCIDYKIDVTDPVLENNIWTIPINIKYDLNKNFKIIVDQIYKYSKSISLIDTEVENYTKLNKPIYMIKFDNSNDTSTLFFRNEQTYKRILSLPYTLLKFCISNTTYDNGFEKMNLFDVVEKYNRIDLESTYSFYTILFEENKDYIEEFELFWYDNGRYVKGNNSKTFIYKDGEEKKIILSNSRYPTIITRDWFQKDISEPYWLLSNSMIKFNMYNLETLMKISFKETRSLEEIKKITEYKVSLE